MSRLNVKTVEVQVIKVKQPSVEGWMNIYAGNHPDSLNFNPSVARGGHLHTTKESADSSALVFEKANPSNFRRLYCIYIKLS